MEISVLLAYESVGSVQRGRLRLHRHGLHVNFASGPAV